MDDTRWLRNVLCFALHATASTEEPWNVRTAAGGGKLVDPDDPGKDPRFRKMVEAILFSRRLLKTYNLVLLGILVVFTAWHWGERLVLHKEKRRRTVGQRNTDTDAWSSSSSTIGGNTTPPTTGQKKTHDETSPLLPSQQPQRKPRSWYWKPYYVSKSVLQYQPCPIPIIEKTLPTNAVSLLVLSWLALTLLYNLYRMPLTFFYLFVFADRCGIIFIANLPLL